MILIPVVDLMHGQAVRAVGGLRSSYQPVASALCEGSDPVVVARALCAHCASTRLYVADLDALTGRPAQVGVLRALLQALPGITLWLDAGFRDAAAAGALRQALAPHADRVVPVFGSESLGSAGALADCFGPTPPGSHEAILSLDRRGAERLDPAGCWDAPSQWPRQLIVMTLERVGSGAGPDLDTLRQVRAHAPQTLLVGAGGVRDEADLARAEQAGADAWLVASALHDGRLPPRRADDRGAAQAVA